MQTLISSESTDIKTSMEIPRFGHQLAQLGDEIFAMGGRNSANESIQTIEKFNFGPKRDIEGLASGDSTWEIYPKSLKIKSSQSFAMTSIPESAIECNRYKDTCTCGKTSRAEKIIGGTVVRLQFRNSH